MLQAKKNFSKFSTFVHASPHLRGTDAWFVKRDTWQRKKQKIASVDIHPFKNQGYRCYAIRSSYNINLIVYIYILYIQIYTYKHLPHTPSKIAVTCHVSRSQNCASIGISRWISMVKTHRYYGRTSRASLPAKWEATSLGFSIFQAWHVTCHAKKGQAYERKWGQHDFADMWQRKK